MNNMDESKEYIHKSLVDQLKETATKLFNLFSDAYAKLNDNVNKANNEFLSLLRDANYIIKPLSFYDDELITYNRNEDFFYIIQILSLCVKASHNLWVIARHNKNKEEMNNNQNLKSYYKGKLYYYYHLAYLLGIDNKTKEIVDIFYKENEYELVEQALGEMTLLDYVFRHGLLDRYLNYEFTAEYKHYFKAYQKFRLLDNIEMDNIAKSLSYYLANNIDDDRVANIIYNSIFFECLLLEHAYITRNEVLVNKVLHLGYDYYLEIDTLYIIYTYDRERYKNYFKELKYISLERLLSLADPNGWNHLLVRDLFPSEFLKETKQNIEENIVKIDRNDKSDYRNRDDRDTPERFKK